MAFQEGLTNMVQASFMAEKMLIQCSHKSAWQFLLVMADGKRPCAWMTNEMVEQLIKDEFPMRPGFTRQLTRGLPLKESLKEPRPGT